MIRVVALVLALGASAIAAEGDPLAGLVLEDLNGTSRTLDELAGTPVLVIVADRRASEQASAWGERLAKRVPELVPWREPGKVTWLSVVDAHGVPEYAHDAARDRIRERQGDPVRARRTTTLIDWAGTVAERLGAEHGRALLVLFSPGHVAFERTGGAPTDAAVDHVVEAVPSVLAR